jgi:CHAD domain-containing protein
VAKARPIPELSEDDPYAVAAARVVEIRARELREQAIGVLDTSDIERVHDMRVATRRLRAALEVFEPCFPVKPYRTGLKEVKALADALGDRRDRDVHIAALVDFSATIGPSDRLGVDTLIARLRDEQREANVQLEPYVEEQRLAALIARLDELASSARESVGA